VNNIECSICGKESKKIYKAEIEEALVEVCENCLNLGKNLGEIETAPIEKKIIISEDKKEEIETIIVDNYGKIIVKAREKKKLDREEFAKKINEKLSVIKRVESEEMEPDDALTKKIERFLEIKLKIPYEEKPIGKKEIKGELTLGDIVELK
jgi:putative transcription factor